MCDWWCGIEDINNNLITDGERCLLCGDILDLIQLHFQSFCSSPLFAWTVIFGMHLDLCGHC